MAVEEQYPGVSVMIRSPSDVPNDMEITQVGGLHIVIKAETWARTTTVRDAIQEWLDEMDLAWELHDTLTQRVPETSSDDCRIALATEVLTGAHITQFPWHHSTNRVASFIRNAGHTVNETTAPAQTSMFLVETMTKTQREVFTHFLTIRREDWLNIHEPIWLALLLAGERPAIEITALALHLSDETDPPMTAEKVAETFSLPHRSWATHSLLVARTSWRFDLLPTPGEVSDAYHRRLGCFLGYPEADIEFFLTTDSSRTQPEDLAAGGMFQPEEIAYTTFVPQQPSTSIAECERAIKTGKANRETIATYASSWDLPPLDAYADWLYHDALTDCLTNM